jgi:multidrug efflux pump
MALGAGAQSRVPLGIVVVGGLFFALILSLFVIPVMYTILASAKGRQIIVSQPDVRTSTYEIEN